MGERRAGRPPEGRKDIEVTDEVSSYRSVIKRDGEGGG